MSVTVVESWLESPLRRFAGEARVDIVLLLHPSGQVLGQHGFTRAIDVMSACALAAAINASASELGKQVDGQPFTSLYHAGRARQIYLTQLQSPRGPSVLLAVFDGETSLGVVQLYVNQLRRELAAVGPVAPPAAPALAGTFETDLNRNLAVLFGRA